MFDPRNNLANEVSAQLIAHFGDKVFRTVIPRNIRLAEAPSFGKPALFHDKESRGALAYLALAGEMIRREEESSGTARMVSVAPAHTASASVPAPGVTPSAVAPPAAAPSVVPPPAPAAAPGATPAENEVTAHTPVTPAGDTSTTVEVTEMAPAVSASPAPQAEDRSR
jgi:hypothetical protein